MDSQSPHPHIHIGVLVIMIALGLLLFKVNIKSVVETPEFKSNVSYIQEKAIDFWDTYLKGPLMSLVHMIENSSGMNTNTMFRMPQTKQMPIEEPENKNFYQMSRPVSN